MRAKDRAEVAELVRKHLAPMNDYMAKIMAVLAALGNDVAEIEPVINRVDLTQEIADDIVSKLQGPLTIPIRVSEWARTEAAYHDMQAFHRVGYGADALEAIWWIKANGTLSLELRYPDGARAWLGVFVPPNFGKSDDAG